MKFTVALHTDDGQRYGVTVPDLPGCFSAAGNDMEEALQSVLEAIDLHVETLMEDGVALPGSMPFSVELDVTGTDELVRRPAALPAA